jgi:hypothetical protein
MLFPTYLYGVYKDVKRRCTKLVKSTTSVDAYDACLLSMGLIDTADASGLLLLDGPSPLVGGMMCFQLYLPLSMIYLEHRANAELLNTIFHESLKTAWGTLLVTSYRCGRLIHEGNRNAYLEAVFDHWHELGTVGPRFTTGSREGQELLDVPTMIQTTLFLVSGLSEEQARRTNMRELFYDMKSQWERRRSASGAPPPPGRAAE